MKICQKISIYLRNSCNLLKTQLYTISVCENTHTMTCRKLEIENLMQSIIFQYQFIPIETRIDSQTIKINEPIVRRDKGHCWCFVFASILKDLVRLG